MYHKAFEYLLDNDPEKVLSKSGMYIRKITNFIVRKIMAPLSTKNKLHIERRADVPKDRPVIYAPTHAFSDDIASALNATGRHCYMLVGALNIVFTTFRGIALWMNGIILVNRNKKDSRSAAVDKMKKLLNMGGNLIMYPEATWNKSKNLLVLKLFPGIYDVATATGALVVPVSSVEENGIVHVIVDEAFDISEYSREEGMLVLRDKMATAKYELMDKYSHMKRADIGDEKAYWRKYIDKLIKDSDGLYVKKEEEKAGFIDKRITTYKQAFAHLKTLIPSKANAFLFDKRRGGIKFGRFQSKV